MSDILQILVSSSRLTVDKRSKDSDFFSFLKDNDVIEAKVLKLFSDRSAQLSLAGKSITVKTHAPLKEGDVVRLRVVSSDDQHVLKLMPKEEPVQQVDKSMAENLERAGPYKNLLKFLTNAGILTTPLKTASTALSQAPLKKAALPSLSEQGPGPSPPSPSHRQEIVQLLDRFLPTLQTRMPMQENKILDLFLHTKAMTPREKLHVLLAAAENEGGERTLPIHQEKEVIRVMGKIFTPSPETENKPSPGALKTPIPVATEDQGQEKPVPVKGLVRASMPQQMPLSESRPETPVVDESRQSGERQAVQHVVRTTALKWPQKILALIASNKEVFIPPEKPVSREVARVIQFLMAASVPEENTINMEASENKMAAMRVPSDLDGTGASPDRPALTKQAVLLENLLRSISLKSDTPDPKFLPTLIQKGGMTWEHKLAALVAEHKTALPRRVNEMAKGDLKGAALSFLSAMDQGDDEMKKALRNFVDTLEQLQVINRVSSEESGRYLLPFPAFFDHAFRFGQLLIDLGKDAGGKQPLTDRVVKVAFILELSALGDLRADFSVFRKSVTGTFGVGKKEIQAVLKKEIPHLMSRLEALGFQVQGIDCQVLDPEELANATLTNQVMQKDGDGVLNLII